jgi:hypothetical protein
LHISFAAITRDMNSYVRHYNTYKEITGMVT